MELTPQLINDEEFTLKVRGYDPDQVDVFLEKVAVGVEQLLDQMREAKERLAAAERRAAEAEKRAADAENQPLPVSTAEADEIESIRRTLVLAQRTADAAVKEAEETAARTVAAAQQQASRVIQEAGEQGRKMVAEAEAEARRASADTRQRMVEEILELERAREAIRADISVLERHVDEQRLRLRSSVGELQRLLDDPSRMRAAAEPELSGISVGDIVGSDAVRAGQTAEVAPPPLPEPVGSGPEPPVAAQPGPDTEEARAPGEVVPAVTEAVVDEPAVDEPAVDEPAADERVADERVADERVADERVADESVAGESVAGESVAGEIDVPAPVEQPIEDPWAPPSHERRPFLDEVDEEAWARFAPDVATLDAGPPTRPVPATAPTSGDDAYLAELRKAMIDDGDVATSQPAMFDQDQEADEPRAKSRFGWRR